MPNAESAVRLLRVRSPLLPTEHALGQHRQPLAPLRDMDSVPLRCEFGGDPAQCWQLRNHDAGDHRIYDQVLQINTETSRDVSTGCWFRERNQPMRLAALASVLAESGRHDQAVAVLTAPLGHESIRRRWAESASMFVEGLLDWLDPEVVLAALEPEAQAFLIDRYALAMPNPGFAPSAVRECLGWLLATRLVGRHLDELMLIETHPAGGMYDCLALYRRPVQPSDSTVQIAINLEGTLHVLPDSDNHVSDREVWERLAGGEIDEIVRWCEPHLGLDATPERDEAWPHVMAVLAQRFRGRARWRSGVLDSSGYASGIRSELFDAIPAVAEAAVSRRDDLDDEPAYRFWFLVDEAGRPLAAVELDTASAWNSEGRHYDLRTAGDLFAAALIE